MSDETEFPVGFPDIGGKSFEWVFHNKKEFVDFTLTEMSECTGLYKVWQDYCKGYNKNEPGHRTGKDRAE